MSAPEKINFQKLGIIAGAGTLPESLISACKEMGIEPYVIGFKGHTNPDAMNHGHHLWSRFGAAGKIIKYLKQNGVKDLVMIGAIKRPSLSEIKPDLKAAKIMTGIGFRALGDNSLLTSIKKALEKEGFSLHPIQKFCEDLVVREGPLGQYSFLPEDETDIELGIKASQQIGALDIGQSIIIQNGIILGVEAVEGTDDLIMRCAALQKKGRGGILIKTCKPQQDKALDMPTIGTNTIKNAYDAGLSGIALHANNVIVADAKNVAKKADQYKLFVVGIPIT